GHGELRHVRTASLEGGDLADALLFDLIDAENGMQGQIRPLDPVELALDPLFRRIHHDRGALAKYELLNLDETEQLAVADPAGIDLVNLALIHEHNAENVTGCHGLERGSLLI